MILSLIIQIYLFMNEIVKKRVPHQLIHHQVLFVTLPRTNVHAMWKDKMIEKTKSQTH